MPKLFPHKDSHRVPWKYDVSLISSRIGKEEVYSNISLGLSGLTRSGRCYNPDELKKKKGKRLARVQSNLSRIGSQSKKPRNS